MVNFTTWIPNYDPHSLLDFFLPYNASICSTMAFPPLGNFDHLVVSVSTEFPTNSKQDAPFQCIANDCFCANWDDLCYHLRDVPWEDIFKLSASAAANKFCDWAQVGIDVCISHLKFQVKPHSSLWYLAACAAAIIHRNHLFLFN